MRKIVGVNERGFRVGESHQHSKLSNAEVDQIRDLREDLGLTYDVIAQHFQVPKATIASICQYRRRAQTPNRYRTIKRLK